MKSSTQPNRQMLIYNGIIAIVFGLLAMFLPGTTLVTLIMYLGILIFLVGLSLIIGVIGNIKNKQPFGVDIFYSLLLMIIGAVLIFKTENVVSLFVILIGLWAILVGIFQLYLAYKSSGSGRKNTFLINGLISLVLGIILFINPFESAKFLLTLTGILAFITGFIMIALSIQLKRSEK